MTNILDFKFDWTKDMETGCTIIDDQHRELLRIGRNVEQLLICYCIGITPKQVLSIIMELRDFVAYSFYEEEKLMKEFDFPKLKEHVNEHREITRYIISLDVSTILKDPYKSIAKLKTYLQDLIFTHILISDKELGAYIEQHK